MSSFTTQIALDWFSLIGTLPFKKLILFLRFIFTNLRYFFPKAHEVLFMIIYELNFLKALATSRRQFTFYHSVSWNSWYSFYQPRKDQRLSRPWSQPVVYICNGILFISNGFFHLLYAQVKGPRFILKTSSYAVFRIKILIFAMLAKN